MTERVTIRGITAAVATPEECEKADVVVCARKGTPSPFTDNLEAPCSGCGAVLIYRPHAPVTPPKMCIECAMEMAEATRQ